MRRFLGPAGELYRLLKIWESIPVTLLVKAEYTKFVSHALFQFVAANIRCASRVAFSDSDVPVNQRLFVGSE